MSKKFIVGGRGSAEEGKRARLSCENEKQKESSSSEMSGGIYLMFLPPHSSAFARFERAILGLSLFISTRNIELWERL